MEVDLNEVAKDIAEQITTDILADIVQSRLSVGGSNNIHIRRQWIEAITHSIENYIRIETGE